MRTGSATQASPKSRSRLPVRLSVSQLLTKVLDLLGRPKHRFYELLALVATDEAERAQLERLEAELDGRRCCCDRRPRIAARPGSASS